MARKFLYLITGVIVALLALLFALRLWSDELTELAFVPSGAFSAQNALPPEHWESPSLWLAKPGLKNNPADWLPQGISPDAAKAPVSVFFVHPTSYIERDQWNAPWDDAKSREQARLYVQAMASPFNTAQAIWAPRYRQAAIGAFLTDQPQATEALKLAYGDVLAAFTTFLRQVPKDHAIALVGHSQGAYHLRHLVKDRIAGTPLSDRLIGVWAIGWPVSIEHDLPAMGLQPCQKADQAGCLISWLTVADPAETGMLLKAYGHRAGLDGAALTGSPFLCSNPLTGTSGQAAKVAVDAKANLGTLLPDFAKQNGTLVPHTVPAACGDDNFLHIGPTPDLEMGPYVLPGNNYHVYDMTLFWANLRADFKKRTTAWQTKQKTQTP